MATGNMGQMGAFRIACRDEREKYAPKRREDLAVGTLQGARDFGLELD